MTTPHTPPDNCPGCGAEVHNVQSQHMAHGGGVTWKCDSYWWPMYGEPKDHNHIRQSLHCIRQQRDQLRAELEEAVRGWEQEQRRLNKQLAEARAYAEKLVAGLPEGMLPKDVENLRDANAALATELAEEREALTQCVSAMESGSPWRTWDMARMYYTDGPIDPNGVAAQWHRGECEKTKAALERARKEGA